jgi:hypothetical protein
MSQWRGSEYYVRVEQTAWIQLGGAELRHRYLWTLTYAALKLRRMSKSPLMIKIGWRIKLDAHRKRTTVNDQSTHLWLYWQSYIELKRKSPAPEGILENRYIISIGYNAATGWW